jgi:hypothetical protein
MTHALSQKTGRSDAFTARFLSRLPSDLALSFSPEQLAAVRLAFGARYRVQHAFDLRHTLHLPWGRYYLVLLLGRAARRPARGGFGRLLADTLCLCGLVAAALSLVAALGLGLAWLLPGSELAIAVN